MRGHADLSSLGAQKFKEGDAFAQAFHASTTDKILIAADDGRFFTIGADKLPGGRGFGEPVRAMIDVEADAGICTMFAASAAPRTLLAATDGRGFMVDTNALVAETRKGRQIMTFRPGAKLAAAVPVPSGADHVAVLGDNRRLLVFPLDQLPLMARGKGVIMQKYRDKGLADVTVVELAEGLSWPMGGDSGRTRSETDLTPWLGDRAAAGRLPPNGFPREAPYFR